MNLLRSLRSGTRGNHDELDRLIDVDAICRSFEHYRDYLLRFERAWQKTEEHIDWQRLKHLGLPDPDRRRQRYGSLATDVAELGASLKDDPFGDGIGLPGSATMPTGADLGMLYVTEGSIHGGSILLARFDHGTRITPPTRFLRGFGEDNTTMWARFINWVNRLGEDEIDPEHAIRGARHAYTLFIRSFSSKD